MEYLLHFGFTSDRLSPMELRDLIRWTVKPQILAVPGVAQAQIFGGDSRRSEEHTSELQSQSNLVCRLLLEKKKKIQPQSRSRDEQHSRQRIRPPSAQ